MGYPACGNGEACPECGSAVVSMAGASVRENNVLPVAGICRPTIGAQCGRWQKDYLKDRYLIKEYHSFHKMEYKVYGLEVMKSTVVLKSVVGMRESHSGREAGAAVFVTGSTL